MVAFGTYDNVSYGLMRLIQRMDLTDNLDDSDDDDWGHGLTTLPIPLVSVNVTAAILKSVAKVEVVQVYENKEAHPIEAVYYFPIPSDGAVIHFEARLNDRVIKGTVKPHEEAQKEYEKAVKNHTTAFLGEETKTDIFKVKVGYLKPGAQAKVIIGYVTEVKNEIGTNASRFYIPTTVAPRYVSPTETKKKDEEVAKMKFMDIPSAPLTLTVSVFSQEDLRSIESPSHVINIQKQGIFPEKKTWRRTLVELKGKTTDMDRDFVMILVPEAVHEPRLYVEKLDNGSTVAMVHWIPSFKSNDLKTEIIFLLDRSGSMAGTSMGLAKSALSSFLHALPADCYFNIVGFGSSYSFLFKDGSQKYDEDSLNEALELAGNMNADLGGTEIRKPLKAIYEQPAVEGYLRQIFILTDGQVNDTDGVLGTIQANADKARVFSLGIGEDASHALVEGMAKAGGGTSAFVTLNERMDEKVLNQLQNGLQPSLTDIELEWEGVKALPPPMLTRTRKPVDPNTISYMQSPKKISPVFDGAQLMVFGLFRNGECPSAVNIKALSPDGPLTFRIEHSPENEVLTGGMMHKLAAVKLVRELELAIAYLPYQHSYLKTRTEKENELKKEVVELACKHGIASKYTSFVAVDDHDQKPLWNDRAMQTRYVPSQRCLGSVPDTSRKRKCSSSAGCAAPLAPKKSCISGQTLPKGGSKLKTYTVTKPLVIVRLIQSQTSTTTPKANPPPVATDPIEKLINLQSFDGSYLLNKNLSDIVGVAVKNMKSEAKALGLKENVYATAVAISFFEKKMTAQKRRWELIVTKSRKWLAIQVTDAKVVEAMMKKAASTF
ncbi:unnamed protein product [Orchesella dallaii]|uniref:von Willebrand factor A domain-containing protein 5A n=1 Tax=Orchesella dallaii TaxID=48710 RepID=A0ABP1QIF1_9HEXA